MDERSAAIQTAELAVPRDEVPRDSRNSGPSAAPTDAQEAPAILGSSPVRDEGQAQLRANRRAARVAVIVAAALTFGGLGVSAWRHHNNKGPVPLPEPTGAVQQRPSVEKAVAALAAKVKAAPDDAEGLADDWRMLGWLHFQEGRFADAAKALKRATALDPENPETFSFLGEALVLAGSPTGRMPRDARRAFEKALQLNPDDVRARYYRASAMDRDGRHRAAIRSWFSLMQDTPADAPHAPVIRKVIVETARKHGIDVEKQLAAARFAPPASGLKIAGMPSSADGKGPTRIPILLPGGREEAAVRKTVEELETRLKAQPRDAEGWILLMRSRMQLGEPARAARVLAQAETVFRNDYKSVSAIREAAKTIGVPFT